MLVQGITPDVRTHVALIDAHANGIDLQHFRSVFDKSSKNTQWAQSLVLLTTLQAQRLIFDASGRVTSLNPCEKSGASSGQISGHPVPRCDSQSAMIAAAALPSLSSRTKQNTSASAIQPSTLSSALHVTANLPLRQRTPKGRRAAFVMHPSTPSAAFQVAANRPLRQNFPKKRISSGYVYW